MGFVECTVEIHDVNHLRTGRRKLFRHRYRIFVVNSDFRLPPLQQSNAFTVSEIDCRNNEHLTPQSRRIRLITSSKSSLLVAIALPPCTVLTPPQSVNVP